MDSNNPIMRNNFVHLLIRLGHLFYEQHIGFVQSSIASVYLILVFSIAASLLSKYFTFSRSLSSFILITFISFLTANFASIALNLSFYSLPLQSPSNGLPNPIHPFELNLCRFFLGIFYASLAIFKVNLHCFKFKATLHPIQTHPS